MEGGETFMKLFKGDESYKSLLTSVLVAEHKCALKRCPFAILHSGLWNYMIVHIYFEPNTN
jgi:hypothetical protein